MTIPSHRDQVTIIRQLINEKKYKEGEKAYLISNSWLSKWKAAVGYDTGQPTNVSVSRIDNNSLLSNGVLKKALSESIDYVIFPKAIWDLFVKWYGGGPAVTVQVDYDPSRQICVPVTRLSSINIQYDQNTKSFQISKYKTIGDLKKLACKAFQLPYDSYKIFDIFNGKKDSMLDDKKIISQLFLKDGITLLLDTNESGNNNSNNNNNNNTKVVINNNVKAKPAFSTNDTLKMNPQSQFSTWLSSSEQTFHLDNIRKSPSRPGSIQRRPSSSSQEASAAETPKDDQVQLTNQFRIQSRSQTLIHDNGATGVCGLTNLGNTCFFNSALQCILHSHILIDYMRSGRYKSDLAPKNPLGTKCQLVNSFSALINQIYVQKSTIAAPKDILSILAYYAPHFSGFSQQDAHELLIFLLDLLHEDMNRAKQNYVKPQIASSSSNSKITSDTTNTDSNDSDIEGDGTNDELIAEKAWNRYKSKNDSIIVDLFHGLLRSQLICPQCNKKVVIFEPFVTLSLPIPGPMTMSPEFIFVPYDPRQPKIRMSLPLTFGLNMSCFKQNLNAELGRNFDIALCTRSHSSGSFDWTNVLPSSRTFSDFIVFEIPDVKTSFYAVSCLSVNRRKSFFSSWFTDNSQMLDDLLLIPIPKQYVEKSELEEACEKRLEYLWDKDDRQCISINSQIIELISSIEPFPPEAKKKFDAEILTSFFDRSELFDNSKIFPFILDKTIKITLNPAYMNDYYGFNWSHLIRPVKDVVPKNEENVKPTLENCIKQFCLGMVLDENNMWFCPHCREFVRANKKTSIWSLPHCLVFQFKRFTQYYNSYRKREGKIDFPDQIDFSPFIFGPVDQNRTKYRLYAVCEHYGSMSGGHYVAHAYVQEKKHWYLFNDSSCRPSNEQDAHNEAAYLLFYERIED